MRARAVLARLRITLSRMGAGGTISGMGGPNSAETDGPGGPLSAGDQIFRDRSGPLPIYTRFDP